MNRVILLLAALTVLVVVSAMEDAYVDAKYWVRDTDDNLIYMLDDKGNRI